jgi:diguanylate cyclase (GGDEF)-like protein
MDNPLETGPRYQKRILLVEDNGFLGAQIVRRFNGEGDFDVVWVRSLAEGRTRLAAENEEFFAAVLDFNLPDAPRGEVIPEVLAHNIPVIIFTASSDAAVREKVWSYNVVDYVFKDDPQSIAYLIRTIRRLENNRQTKVMVVDDSSFFRKVLTDLLRTHLFQVLSATDAETALALLGEHPDIRLVLTDYEMPGLNGLELTRKIRQNFSRDELAIIGISSAGDQVMAANFIKSGASDFIIKQTFLTEEFYSRVSSNIENIERAQMILELSIRDYLTGLYNRRYLFEAGRQLLARVQRRQGSLACAMLDIDFFKRVNDDCGHDAGDQVLRRMGAILKEYFRAGDIVARFGGEEFCILAADVASDNVLPLFEKLREKIAATEITTDSGKTLRVTVSIGVCEGTGKEMDLEKMIRLADKRLYQAKNGGRNRVVAVGD